MTRRRWLVPTLTLVAAGILAGAMVAGGSGSASGGGGDGGATPGSAPPAPVAVTSDALVHATLAELVAASDLVVRGTVTSVERGRVFGAPGEDAALVSRLVGVEVTEVLRGAPPPDGLLVEEEGWLPDGSPLVVDGLGPPAVGDDATWFLVDPVGAEPAAFTTTNGQGRYTVVDGVLVGAEGDDPLVARVEALGPRGLAHAVRRAP